MKNIKIILLVGLLVMANGCQDIKQGLTGEKKNNSDEFLVKKKNKLVLPPDFEKLPEPKMTDKEENNNNNFDEDIRKLLGQSPKENKTKTANQKKSKIESTILEKINAK
jgi:hypothetical protein